MRDRDGVRQAAVATAAADGFLAGVSEDYDQAGQKASEFFVRTVIMDLSPYPGESSGLRWEKPVAEAVSAGVRQTQATELAPFLLTGVGGINASNTVNGQPYAPVVYATQRYFDTVQQAEAWTSTEEYRSIVEMIASFNG